MRSNAAEVRLAHLAVRQHGTFTRPQAIRAGMSERQVDGRLRAGLWVRLYPGVYVSAGTPVTWHVRVLAACLSAGPGAAASHRTAGVCLGLLDARTTTIEVTVPHARHRADLGERVVHRARSFGRGDVRRVDGIPVTCPERTIVDLAGILGAEQLEAVIDVALRRRIVSSKRLRRYMCDRQLESRRGTGRLRRLLDDRERGVPEGQLERQFLRLLDRYGLPHPARQHRVGRYRIDFAYPDQRVAIELDDYGSHSGLARLKSDRRRQNVLVLEDWRVIRFTWDDVTREPDGVRRTLIRSGVPLRRRRPGPRQRPLGRPTDRRGG